jgi:SNF2 family DNA or RNA helicase
MPENYRAFVARYGVIEQLDVGPRKIWQCVGIQDPVGLMQRLEPIWFRATKETCLDLPPKRYTVVRLKFPPETEALYRDLERDGECVLGNPLSLSSERVVQLRLHQICGGHQPVYAGEEEINDADPVLGSSAYRMSPLPCPKLAWLARWAEDVLAGNPSARAIVWVRYNHERARIAGRLREILGEGWVAEVWGETSNPKLEEIKASFNSRDVEGVQVIVAQVKKLAFGHNLQSADTHVFFSNDWSYVTRVQAEDRSHRMGREGAVEYFDLVIDTRQSVDQKILDAFARHEDLAERIARETVPTRGGDNG